MEQYDRPVEIPVSRFDFLEQEFGRLKKALFAGAYLMNLFNGSKQVEPVDGLKEAGLDKDCVLIKSRIRSIFDQLDTDKHLVVIPGRSAEIVDRILMNMEIDFPRMRLDNIENSQMYGHDLMGNSFGTFQLPDEIAHTNKEVVIIDDVINSGRKAYYTNLHLRSLGKEVRMLYLAAEVDGFMKLSDTFSFLGQDGVDSFGETATHVQLPQVEVISSVLCTPKSRHNFHFIVDAIGNLYTFCNAKIEAYESGSDDFSEGDYAQYRDIITLTNHVVDYLF